MNGTDPDIQKLFHHVRMAVDALEKIIVHIPLSGANEQARVEQDEPRIIAATASAQLPKLAYTLNEVRDLVGISRSAIYLALGAGDLRAIKSGRKTLVLAKDLQAWLERLPAKS
jgi:excisionase family DNA binding protein